MDFSCAQTAVSKKFLSEFCWFCLLLIFKPDILVSQLLHQQDISHVVNVIKTLFVFQQRKVEVSRFQYTEELKLRNHHQRFNPVNRNGKSGKHEYS